MAQESTNEQPARWSVGELAHLTGLSVRVLRHWDEIGLVCPGRTTGGHRCYTRAEVSRLYRVLALRQMGLRLGQIAALFTNADPTPTATLRAHLAHIEDELRARQALRDRLVEILRALDQVHDDADGELSVDLLMKVIEKMTMFDQHLSPTQREWFSQRRTQVGGQTWQEAIDTWPELISAVRREMDAGTDPAEPRVQELLARWDATAEVFLGDSAEMRVAAGRAWRAIWEQHPDQLRQSPRIAPPEMWDYIQRAKTARGEHDRHLRGR